jgi:hypothetical protein
VAINRNIGVASALLALLITPVDLVAQTAHVHPAQPDSPEWTWSWDANAFVGLNYQRRKFRDFQEVESQNWLMGAGDRSIGRGRLRLHAMLSFEPFTIQPSGRRRSSRPAKPISRRSSSTISTRTICS